MSRPRPKENDKTQLPRGVFLRGGDYWIEYHHNGQRHREKVGKSRSAAQTLYIKRKEELRLGKKLGLNKRQLTVGDLIDEFLPTFRLEKSRPEEDERYAMYWKDELGNQLADELEATEVELRKAKLLTAGRRPATVNRYLAHLRHVLTLAWKREMIRRNPMASVAQLPENNTRKRVLRPEEEAALLPLLDQDGRDVVELALETGMRQENIFSLSWPNVYLGRDLVEVILKGGRAHSIYLSDRAKEILQRRSDNRDSELWVFPSSRNSPGSGIPNHLNPKNWYNRVFKPALTTAGIEDFVFHDLKHTYVSRALEKGIDAKTVQELVGNKTLSVVAQRYSNLSAAHLRASAKKATRKPGSEPPPEPPPERPLNNLLPEKSKERLL